MSNAETIKEFLVALGFKIDEQSFKKFDEATGLSTKKVAVLGLAVTAAAAATEAFVAKVAASLDKLYFASKRTGASAGEINAFSYAVEQMGGTAEDAQNSLESLARFMRTQPGAGGILTRMFGVKPENIGDAAKSMNDIAGTFQRMAQRGQQPLVYRLAAMLGIDEKTMLAMEETGKFNDRQKEYQQMLKNSGVDLESLTKEGMEFSKQLNMMERSFGLLAYRIEGYLLPVMGKLNTLILNITGGKTGGANDYKSFSDYIDKRGYGGFLWDSFTGGLPMLGSGAKILGGTAYSGAATILGGKGAGSGAAQSVINEFTKGSPAASNDNTGMAKQAMDFFMNAGWSAAQASGIVANLARESGFNPGAVGDSGKARGIAQWHPDRQAAFTALTGKDISSATLADQLGFVQYELTQGMYKNAGKALSGATDPATAASLVARLYEKPANLFNEATLRGNMAQQIYGAAGGGATLNQTTTISVNGGSNPQDTANAVAGAQTQTNNQAIRNLSGAVR